MASAIQFQVNTREFDAAISRYLLTSKRGIAETVNKKGAWIFYNASKNMPAVPAERIKSELQASQAMELVKLKSGRFSRNKRNLKYFFHGAGAPLLALIIQSRASARGRSPWFGVSRQEGAERMLKAMRRVFGARLRSRAFFKSAVFGTARDIFRRAVNNKRDLPAATTNRLVRDEGRVARVIPAKPSAGKISATFELISAKHDIKAAIDKYAAPVLQRAIDQEAGETWRHAIETELKEAARLAGIRTA